MGKPRTPTELGAAGKALWKTIFDGIETEDPRELHAIRQACRLEDDVVRLRAELDDAPGLVTKGSTGQPVESPLLGSIRNAVALQSKLLATVAIDDISTSTAGRRLVSSRYN